MGTSDEDRTMDPALLLAALTEAPGGYALLAPSGKVRFANAGAERLLGPALHEPFDPSDAKWEVHDATGRLLPRDEWPVVRAARRGESIAGMEIDVVRGDGARVTLRVNASPIHDAAGRPTGVFVAFDEITASRRRERALAFLDETSALLASSLDYETTLARVAELTVPELADFCLVEIIGDDGTVQPVAMAHPDADRARAARDYIRRHPPTARHPYGALRVLQRGESVFHAEVTDELLRAAAVDEEHLAELRAAGYRSTIQVPLKARGRTFGAITLATAESGRRYTRDDLGLAEELAFRASLAVENARAYAAARSSQAAAERLADRTARLQAVTARLSEAITPRDVAAAVIADLLPALGAAAGAVGEVRGGDWFHMLAGSGAGAPSGIYQMLERVPLATSSPITDAARTGEAVWLSTEEETAARYPQLASWQAATGTFGWCAVPLVAHGRCLGAIGVGFATARAFSDEDRDFMLTLARQCAQALERAQLYGELHESEERYRLVIEAIPQMVWTASADGRGDYYNRRWVEYTGLGGDWAQATHVDDVAPARASWARAVAAGEPFHHEARFRRASDGSFRWHLLRALPLREADGRVSRYFGTATDIDDQKRAEERHARLLEREQAARQEAEAANRMKDEFLATLSHELRTPLTAMLGWAQMLRGGRIDEAHRQRALETIERNARQQAQLVEDILDVSRIIAGKLRINRESVELAPVVEAALDTVRPTATARAVRLDVSLDPDAGPVMGDEARLQQIVWNLVSNAVKFSPPMSIVAVQLERAGGQARLVVADRGEGIAPEFLPHVFDRFRQADSSSARRHGGLGLGLAIVRHLVELHDGEIVAESDGPGLGARFTVTLPIAAPIRPRALTPIDGVPTQPGVLLRGLAVLVVEDELDHRELLRVALEREGASVRAVDSVEAALAAMRERRPDVLVSDIGMPGQDGYELIRRIRSLDVAAGGGVPAIALTAYAGPEDTRRAMTAGYQKHIAKPADPELVVSAIARLAGRRRRDG